MDHCSCLPRKLGFYSMSTPYSKRCWFTFPTRTQVEQPIIWQMSRKFPEVSFDIRQASVQNEIGIMAVLLSGSEAEVTAAIAFLRSKGVTVEPIEKSVVEG
jgi:ABC-type methionine transport system ATPase subunit